MKGIRDEKGEAAKNKSWRCLQVAFHNKHPEFTNDDLEEYIIEYCTVNNPDASEKLFLIEDYIKSKLVFQYLMKHSDEEHVVTASEIVAYLQEIGISAERRSIYGDIEEINKALYIAEYECPLDEALEALEDEEERIVVYDSAKRGYYVRQRHYELDDIRLLIECIYATKFIDERIFFSYCRW